MSTFCKRSGWWMTVAAVLVLAVPRANADDGDPNCNNGGGGGPDFYYSPYWQAYQQWLQWQQKLYDDHKAQLEQMKQDRIDRQLIHPPVTEVWAAEPLNALLTSLQDMKAKGTDLPDIAVNPDVVKHLNLTPGEAGNLGLLKNDGHIAWPLILRTKGFRDLDERVEGLTTHLVLQARGGDVDPDDYQSALKLMDKQLGALKAQVTTMSAPDYIQGKRFLTDLTDSIRALNRPDVAAQFANAYAAQGHTVAEVIQNMTEKGLRFAPATPADRAAYLALHQAMASCYLAATAPSFLQ